LSGKQAVFIICISTVLLVSYSGVFWSIALHCSVIQILLLYCVFWLQIFFEIAATDTETLMIRSPFKASLLRQFLHGHVVQRKLSTSSCASMFYEPYKAGEPRKPIEISPYKDWKEGVKLIGGEVSKFKDEVVWKFRCDHLFAVQHGDYEILWKFDNQETIDSWNVTSDKDNNEGQSTAELVMTANHHALFQGRLDTTVPKDGITKRAGYCSMRSPPNFVRSLIHIKPCTNFDFV